MFRRRVPEPNSVVDESEGRYQVVFESVAPATIYFSDRPARITGHTPMQAFLHGLGFSEENPPNAAIEVLTPDGGSDVVVAELMNPRWDEVSRTLSYEIRILEDASGEGLAHYSDRNLKALPGQFGAAAVFIDDCPNKVIYCFKRSAIINAAGSTFFGRECVGPDEAEASDYCGPLDGEKGTCWNWASAACRPCKDYFKECDAAYPDCDSFDCGRTFTTKQDGSHAGEVAQ